jgi:hypothetical protein
MSVLGSIAVSFVANQPLLTDVFGQHKGAVLTLAAIAISHAATTITAYSGPIDGPSPTMSVPVFSMPTISVATPPPHDPGTSAAVVGNLTPIIPVSTGITAPSTSTTVTFSSTEGQKPS